MRALVTIALVILASQAMGATERDLDRWVDGELVPYMRQQLLEFPRFRGETVMFVVLHDNAPATTSNALALSLRDRLLDAAVDTPGITVGWKQGQGDAHFGGEPIDCTRNDVDYYIGLEVVQQIDNRYSITVRALDLAERSWVAGFNTSWHGQLSMTQRQAVREQRVDQSFLGARDVPFSESQTDLLARHLAHDLSCELMRQTSGDYVIPSIVDEDNELPGTVELVSNNISTNDAVELTRDAELANAVLTGKAHPIGDGLYQYWLTVTPTGEDSELTSLSVSAYIFLPDRMYAGERHDEETALPVTVAPATLRRDPTADTPTVGIPGGSNGPGVRQAFAQDVVVFFVEHRPLYGLVRTGGHDCRRRTSAHVVRGGEALQFPVTTPRRGSTRLQAIDEWLVAPPHDTYYAIGVSDERLARQIANHIDALPVRCGNVKGRGLYGNALDTWLYELESIAAASGQEVDWRAIEVKEVL